jgi:hypothetical protein
LVGGNCEIRFPLGRRCKSGHWRRQIAAARLLVDAEAETVFPADEVVLETPGYRICSPNQGGYSFTALARYATLAIASPSLPSDRLSVALPMPASPPPAFQVHWSLVPQDEAGDLVPRDCRLLAIWPAPVNHDVCFKEAGFSLFGDNDAAWDQAAERLLGRVLEILSRYGHPKLVGKQLRDNPPWYLFPFRAIRELPLLEQALLSMHLDSLPQFHTRFGEGGAALRTGSGHFLLWITLPDGGEQAFDIVREAAEPWPICGTALRWAILLPTNEPL